MLGTASRYDLEELSRQLERAMDRLVHSQFSHFRCTTSWSPAINAYRLPDRIEVCVDLAGVAKESLAVRAERGVLTLRGFRQAPHPAGPQGEPIQILTMEIDHGPFERQLAIPRQVAVDRVTAEQKNGMLWIMLPLE